MCGIVASIGETDQVDNVVAGLKKLEYRGYDSSGIAFLKQGKICAIKSVGTIENLQKKIMDTKANIVIGHTRWATHGAVSEDNAHPHLSFDKKITIVHNGIIENHKEIKKAFLSEIDQKSQTDSEIFANLIAIQEKSSIKKLIFASQKTKGSFAVAMLCEGEKAIYLAKRNSPLYVACDEKFAMAASDISVFAGKFHQFYIMENDEFAVMKRGKIEFFDSQAKHIEKQSHQMCDFQLDEENFDEKYFMLKEINEQSFVLKKTYFEYFSANVLSEDIVEQLKKFSMVYFVACGTAYHSTLIATEFFQKYVGVICKNQIASEFRYSKEKIVKNCLYVFVSQSGETADTIECAKKVKQMGGKVLCVTNVPYSTLNTIADYVVPTFAGRECAVASTKAYTAQVFTLLILAIKLSKTDLMQEAKNFVMNYHLELRDNLLHKEILKFKKVFFMGRGQDYATSLEAALKLKEIAYINCLGIAAGELKHGTLALVDENTLVVAISTQEKMKEKLENNIEEVKARGGKVLLVSSFNHFVDVDFHLHLAGFDECFMPIVSIIPLQKLAFDCAVALGHNPDKPRNLAKSVTVE